MRRMNPILSRSPNSFQVHLLQTRTKQRGVSAMHACPLSRLSSPVSRSRPHRIRPLAPACAAVLERRLRLGLVDVQGRVVLVGDPVDAELAMDECKVLGGERACRGPTSRSTHDSETSERLAHLPLQLTAGFWVRGAPKLLRIAIGTSASGVIVSVSTNAIPPRLYELLPLPIVATPLHSIVLR